MSNKTLASICAKHGFPDPVVDAMKKIPTVEVNELTRVSVILDPLTSLPITSYAASPSGGYYCHLWAGASSESDAMLPDISGAQHHATFNAGMTKAIAWAAPGFAKSNNALANQSFVMPAINYDYAAGESLIITYKGRGTPQAAAKGLFANSTGSGSPGLCLRSGTDGRMQVYLADAASEFLQPSVNVAFEAGVTHAFTMIIDGLNRTYAIVEDGVLTRPAASIGAGRTIDTRSANACMLGTQDAAGVASNALPMQLQALIVLRGRIGVGLPENWLELVKAMQLSPNRLISSAQW